MKILLQNLHLIHDTLKHAMILGAIVSPIDPKYLREYRCPSCNKLLAKGVLADKDSVLEVKCRGCSTICLFKGEDAEIVKKRSELLKTGVIPDTEEKT